MERLNLCSLERTVLLDVPPASIKRNGVAVDKTKHIRRAPSMTWRSVELLDTFYTHNHLEKQSFTSRRWSISGLVALRVVKKRWASLWSRKFGGKIADEFHLPIRNNTAMHDGSSMHCDILGGLMPKVHVYGCTLEDDLVRCGSERRKRRVEVLLAWRSLNYHHLSSQLLSFRVVYGVFVQSLYAVHRQPLRCRAAFFWYAGKDGVLGVVMKR